MAIDGIILDKYVKTLNEQLPFRINKIYHISNNELLFNIRANGQKKQLIISTSTLYNRIHFTNKEYPNNLVPTNFVNCLRKYLENGTLYSIKQYNLDRYLEIEIANRDDLKDKKIFKLYVELMGKYANVILVNQDNKIIDALKRIPPSIMNKRTIYPNAEFTLPEAQNKLNPFNTTNYDINIDLTKQFSGFSPLLSKEILYRINNNESFTNILNEIKNSNNIYLTKLNNSFEFHLIPLTHISNKYIQYNINDAMDYIYYELEEKDRIKQITNDISKFITRNIKQLKNKLPKLQSSLVTANDYQKYKDDADLIYTYCPNDQNGLTSIEIIDFNNTKHIIDLDSKYSLKNNAKRLYTKYNKNKKAIEHLNIQISKCNEEIEYFTCLNEQLEIANYNDAKEIRQELINNNYLFVKETHKKKKKEEPLNISKIQYKEYTITYGKNNLQNDLITWHIANKNDTWFHTKDYHGSHVIINGNNLDEDTIRYCANLAAYYSKGRYSSSVPVNYCLVSQLKKIPKSKIGLVSLSNYKTIYIDPELDNI